MSLSARATKNIRRLLLLLGALLLSAALAVPAVAEATAAETSTTSSTEATSQTATPASATPATADQGAQPAQDGVVPPLAGLTPLNPGWKTDQVEVRVLPEYDERAVLVILRLSLPADVALPATLKLPIPAGSWIVGIGEVDLNGRFKYNYADSYPAVEPGAVWDIASIEVKDFRRLQVDYYYDPGLPAGAGNRSFPVLVQVPMDADALVLHIQQPIKATDFEVQPVPQGMGTVGDGFNYAVASYTDVKAGSTLGHFVSYNNPDGGLSVEAYGVGSDPSGSSSVSTNTVLLAAILVVVVLVGAVILWRMSASSRGGSRNRGGHNQGRKPAAAPTSKGGSRQSTARGSKGSSHKAVVKTGAAGPRAAAGADGYAESDGGSGEYCVACGEELTAKSRFCPNCGEAR